MEPLAPAVAQGSPGEADRGGRPRAGPSPLPPVRSPTVTRGRGGARAHGSTPEGARPRSRGRRALSAEGGARPPFAGGHDKENRPAPPPAPPAPPPAPAACAALPAAPACVAAGEGAGGAAPARAGPRRRGAGVLVA